MDLKDLKKEELRYQIRKLNKKKYKLTTLTICFGMFSLLFFSLLFYEGLTNKLFDHDYNSMAEPYYYQEDKSNDIIGKWECYKNKTVERYRIVDREYIYKDCGVTIYENNGSYSYICNPNYNECICMQKFNFNEFPYIQYCNKTYCVTKIIV